MDGSPKTATTTRFLVGVLVLAVPLRLLHHNTLRIVRANPKITYRDLRLRLGLDGTTVSKATLYREIKKHGITNWMAKK